MRELTDHKVNPANDVLTVAVTDEPGSGGAHHMYEVSGYKGKSGANSVLIEFQNGPINEAGVNGLTHEALCMPMTWPRAAPADLAAFDPSTKLCTMNCGPHRDDPRTGAERKLLCGDCVEDWNR